MLSYESSLFLAVVASLIFAGCAWLFSFGNTVDMFDEIRRMDKRQVKNNVAKLCLDRLRIINISCLRSQKLSIQLNSIIPASISDLSHYSALPHY